MKFDYIIGNPPYHEDSQGDSTGSNPLYHFFYDEACKLSDVVELITPARFLFNAGKTPKVWNQKMLNNPHFKVILYEQNPDKIFRGVPLTGGVAISTVNQHEQYGSIVTFTPHMELGSIVNKINKKNEKSLRDIIYVHSKFNLDELYKYNSEYKGLIGSEGKDKRVRANALEKFDCFSVSKHNDSDIKVLGLINNKRDYRYINRSLLEEENWLDKYKVFVPESNGASGMLGEEAARIISKPVLGWPGEGVTQTFIVIGSLNTFDEANNLLKFILSKFTRVLIGSLKATQRNNSVVWQNVPLEDFSDHSDIDWSKSVKEIDQQLYKKYNLSDEEIKFIEKHVKEME